MGPAHLPLGVSIVLASWLAACAVRPIPIRVEVGIEPGRPPLERICVVDRAGRLRCSGETTGREP